jgi:hypothetical protein
MKEPKLGSVQLVDGLVQELAEVLVLELEVRWPDAESAA